MSNPELSDELAREAVDAYLASGRNKAAAARALGLPRNTFANRLKHGSERGMLGYAPVMPGFRVSQVTTDENGKKAFIQQKPERGDVFEMPAGQRLKAVSALLDQDDREIIKWVKTTEDQAQAAAAMRAAIEGFKEQLPRAEAVTPPGYTLADLLAQYTVTDAHMGALAWHEETGDDDYDIKIAEAIITDWFYAAIDQTPPAQTAVLAQLGDLLHWDGFESVTPTSRHVLDGDSRFPKMVRAAIRVLRRVIERLLTKHDFVHIIMADANHDPASEVWLREMFSVFYENDPRVSVDNSAGTYYAYKHGDVSLFYHHGHRRKITNVDSVFAGRFRDMYGATKFSYAHIGHLHNDELKSTNLMKVERHETLAAPDAYAANGGWLSGRSAKVITYHKQFGEVGRITLTPAMVAGASERIAGKTKEKAA